MLHLLHRYLRIHRRPRQLRRPRRRHNSGNKWSIIVEIFEIDPVPAARFVALHDVALLRAVARARSTAFAAAGTRHAAACFCDAIADARSCDA
jgi:hypothetical protein